MGTNPHKSAAETLAQECSADVFPHIRRALENFLKSVPNKSTVELDHSTARVFQLAAAALELSKVKPPREVACPSLAADSNEGAYLRVKPLMATQKPAPQRTPAKTKITLMFNLYDRA